jgi:hypothetical protein
MENKRLTAEQRAAAEAAEHDREARRLAELEEWAAAQLLEEAGDDAT